MTASVVHADLSHVDALAGLFDAYRQFYGQAANAAAAGEFLRERLTAGDSTILLAIDADHQSDRALGFTQLYPGYSSVSMRKLWILNDLYVHPDARRRGVASQLLEAAVAFGRATSAVRLVLATAVDNHQAKALYARHGWRRDEGFQHFLFPLDDDG
ncbi:MAG: GNAT family N-acetyltransferase [Pirellulaceae bacterium]